MSKGMDRREFVKSLAALAALGVFAVGYSPVIYKIVKPKNKEYGPDLLSGPGVRVMYSTCLGCNVRCGIRVRVVDYNGVEVVERIEGNPYHPYNRAVAQGRQVKRYKHLAYNTPVRESLKYTGTLCPRGQDGIHYLYDPYRVLKPLKRAGPRGSGKWKVISWEQLIREVVEGGVIEETGERLPGLKDFFVYGKLREAGFEDPNAVLKEMKSDVDRIVEVAKSPESSYEDLKRAIDDFKSKWSRILGEKGLKLEDVLIDPDRPELGTKANMVVWMRGRGQGHSDYISKRFIMAFGSVNWHRHTSACQLGYYTGNKLWAGYHDIQADVVSAKVIIMAGAALGRLHPGATGQGLLIERAAEGEVKIYYVNPVAPRVENRNIIWVPVKPGEDAALAMAIIRWIIENERYNKEFLEAPNLEAAKARGYPVFSNATWLVIADEGSERFGEFLKDKDVGMGEEGVPLVYSGGELKKHTDVEAAELDWEGYVTLADGSRVRVKTAFRILKDEATSRSLGEWSEISGVPVETIIAMAKDFADASPMAATILHRGVGQHTNGEYAVWAYRMIDTLMGNFHRKGGLLARAAHTNYNKKAYNTNYKGFGEPVKWGPMLTVKHRYEDTLEYWLRLKRGENPYPTRIPWFPLTAEESYTVLFKAIAEGYPYKVGALIMFYANPVLSANAGVKYIEALKDTSKLPLFIAITTTINETFMYADYIVPDTTYLETGTMGAQYLYASSAGVLLAEGWRSPAVKPMTEYLGKCPNGHDRYADMWEFFIDVAKKLGMPGFGEKGINGIKGSRHEGKWFSLHCGWEYILRVFANGALDAWEKGLIPDPDKVPEEDVKFVEENYIIAKYKDVLPPDEWRLVAYGLARGGVFTSYEESFDDRGISKRKVPGDKVLKVWNEKVAKTRNTITGEKFWGGPKYFPPATYAPAAALAPAAKVKGAGTPLKVLYGEEYPMTLIFESGPLYTKHRSQFYYWIKAITPENFAVINEKDAQRLGIKTGDIVRIETPHGSIEVPAVVEPTVREGVIVVPYGMGRWADTIVVKPRYVSEVKDESVKLAMDSLPDKAEVPEEAVNPVKGLPELVKKLLFTKSPKEYYEKGLAPDRWRFSGVSPNPVELADPTLEGWPAVTWLGAGQSYYETPARIAKTGRKHKFEVANIVW